MGEDFHSAPNTSLLWSRPLSAVSSDRHEGAIAFIGPQSRAFRRGTLWLSRSSISSKAPKAARRRTVGDILYSADIGAGSAARERRRLLTECMGAAPAARAGTSSMRDWALTRRAVL
jgi:hypothetical protein